MTIDPPRRSVVDGIACIELGRSDAPALVCCHGMALDHTDLLELVRPLATGWRVVLWDMPGHGDSRPLPPHCSLATMTDALEVVIDAFGISNPILLGFSFGGMVAQSLIRRHPHSVRAFIAMACFAPFSAPPPMDAATAEQILIGPMATLPWDQVSRGFAAACSVDPNVQARLLPAIERLGPAGLMAMTRALFNSFEAVETFRIDHPLLIVRGNGDLNGAALVTAARALLASSPLGQEVVIEAAGHCVHLDQPQAVQHVIRQFLDELST